MQYSELDPSNQKQGIGAVLRSNASFRKLLRLGVTVVGWLLFASLPLLYLPPFAALLAAFVVYLIVPGWLVVRLVHCGQTGFIGNVLLGFGISLGILSVIATVGLMLRLNLDFVTHTYWWVASILYVATSVQILLSKEDTGRTPRPGARLWPGWNLPSQTRFVRYTQIALLILAASSIAYVAWTKVLIFDGSFDRHFYQGFILHFLDAANFYDQGIRFAPTYNYLSPRDMLQPWPVVLAAVIKAGQTDLQTSYITFLPALLIVLAFCSLYVLGRKITYSWIGGLVACAVQIIYYYSDISNNDSIGFNFLLTIIEDKFLIRFVLLLIVWWLVLEYYRSGNHKWIVPLAFTCIAVSLTHFIGALMLGVVLGSFGLLSLLRGWRRSRPLVVAVLFGIVMVMGIVPFLGRFGSQQNAPASATWNSELDFESGLNTDELGSLRRRRLLIFSDEPPQYILSPHALEHPIVLSSLILAPGLFFFMRRSAARLLLALTIPPLILVYTPYLTPLIGNITTPWMLWRILWIMQPALVLAFAVDQLTKRLYLQVRRKPWALWLPTVLVAGLALLLWPRMANSMGWLNERGARIVTPAMVDLLHYLRGNITHGSLIVAEATILNDELPGMVGHSFGTTFRWEEPPLLAKSAVEQQRNAFFASSLLTEQALAFLQTYRTAYPAIYIAIDRDRELVTQLDEFSHSFVRVYANSQYLVYQWRPDAMTEVEQRLLAANSLLATQQGDEAASSYASIQNLQPDNLLALIGLAQATAPISPTVSANYYEQAFVRRPHDAWLALRAADAKLAQPLASQLDLETALTFYQQALALLPTSERILDYVEDRFVNTSQLQSDVRAEGLRSAIAEHYLANSERQPNSVRLHRALLTAYNELAGAALAAENFPAAEQMYRRAIQAGDSLAGESNVRAYTGLLKTLLAQSKTSAALDALQQARTNHPNVAWPAIEMGKIYLTDYLSDVEP